MKRLVATLALIIMVLSLQAGCRTVGSAHRPSPGTQATKSQVANYRQLEVAPFTMAEGFEQYGEYMGAMRGVFLEYAPKEGLYETVSDRVAEGQQGVLRLNVKLLRAKSVSRTKRVMLGIMAGRSGMEVEASLTDRATGDVLAKDVILVQSALSAGAFAGTDRETINHSARELINFIKAAKGPTN